MLRMLKSLWIFIQYWYMRYLLVTELYMVEKWERIMIHFVFFMIFCVISLLNASVMVQSVRWLMNNIYPRPYYLDALIPNEF